MQRIQFWVLISFICITFSGMSQTWKTDWGQKFGNEYIAYFSDVIEDINGGFTIVGSKTISDTLPNDFWLVRLTHSGDIYWSRVFSVPEFLYPQSIAQNSDGSYLLSGTVSIEKNRTSMVLLKVDSLGNEIWQKKYEKVLCDSHGGIIILPDNGFVVLGTKNAPSGNQTMGLVKFDSNGIVEWEKEFGGNDNAISESVKQLPDGGFAIAGQISKKGKRDSDMLIVRTNSTGETVWQSQIPSPGKKVWPECICCSPDSNLLVVGWYGKCLTDINSEDPVFDYDLIISQLDSNGKLLWTKNYDGEGSEGGNNVLVRPDGTILIAGKKATSFTGKIGPWLFLLNESGEVINDHLLPFNFRDDQASKVINTSDGGFAVVGPGYQPELTNRSFGWIVKFSDL